jgi:hypothetical protein
MIFINIHQSNIATFDKNQAFIKLSGAVNHSSVGISHLILTNPHNGSARMVNSVHFLSFPKDQTLGHIPTANS